MTKNCEKVVLAYSGGLDTSVIVPWLKENYDCEVITFTGNLGQGEEELVGLEEKAIASGASRAFIADMQEEFLTEYAFPTMQAGAIYEGLYLLGTSFARPLIAKCLVKVAEEVGAYAVIQAYAFGDVVDVNPHLLADVTDLINETNLGC